MVCFEKGNMMHKYSVGDIVVLKPWDVCYPQVWVSEQWWRNHENIPKRITEYDYDDNTYCLDHHLWVEEYHIIPFKDSAQIDLDIVGEGVVYY